VLLLLVLIGVYGAFFSTVVFSVGRDKIAGRSGDDRQPDAIAQEISCTPNWFVLGAVSRCRATVVKPDGTRYSFSSFANEMSAEDVGREVAMTEYRERHGRPVGRFYPSKVYPVNTFGMLLGFFGSVVLATIVPLVLWPRRPKRAVVPALLSDVDKLARVAKLRKRSWIFVGLALVSLYTPYVTYGFFIADRAFKSADANGYEEGVGEVTDCSRDWTYLGQMWSCDLTVTVSERNIHLSPSKDQLSFQVTLHNSRFTPDDIGQSFPLTANPTTNPFAHGYVWEHTERKLVPGVAELVAILTLLGGLILMSCFQHDRKTARKLEREATAPPVVEVGEV
jgi:hypothetical protein